MITLASDRDGGQSQDIVKMYLRSDAKMIEETATSTNKYIVHAEGKYVLITVKSDQY